MLEKNQITFDEFEEILWNDVPQFVVSDEYLAEYDYFINELTFSLYTIHLKMGVGTKELSKITEVFFENLFRYRSSCEDLGSVVDKNSDRY